jgi:hypothetical protein
MLRASAAAIILFPSLGRRQGLPPATRGVGLVSFLLLQLAEGRDMQVLRFHFIF